MKSRPWALLRNNRSIEHRRLRLVIDQDGDACRKNGSLYAVSIRMARMTAVLRAGVTYFAIVYVVGFLLGTVRVLLLTPRIGEVGAVLLETPIMLGASWFASRWSTTNFALSAAPGPRLAMGGLAFALLVTAEITVSILAFGRSWTDLLDVYRSEAALIGSVAQVAFALLPVVQTHLERSCRRRTASFRHDPNQ